MKQELNGWNGSRTASKSKKRKANMVLNICIGIVAVLILFVGGQLLFGNNDKNESSESKADVNKNKAVTANVNEKSEAAAEESSEEEGAAAEEENGEEEPAGDSEEAQPEEIQEKGDPAEGATVKEGEPGSEVKKIIENPSWKPVGTVQTGEHSAVYDQSSVDWAEMTRSISYATRLPESEMTILWLGNGGSPNHAVSTVQSKDGQNKYKVYIEWVDNEGWKPVKVEDISGS